MSLIDNTPSATTVRANGQIDVMILGRSDFLRHLPDASSFEYAVLRGLVASRRKAERQIQSLALLDVRARVVRALLDMAELEGEVRVIRRLISRRYVADLVGASPEWVGSVMAELEKRGLIKRRPDARFALDAKLSEESS